MAIAHTTETAWTFYWLDGRREVLTGATAKDALNRAGVGPGALGSLDVFVEGDSSDYTWDPTARTWRKTIAANREIPQS